MLGDRVMLMEMDYCTTDYNFDLVSENTEWSATVSKADMTEGVEYIIF